MSWLVRQCTTQTSHIFKQVLTSSYTWEPWHPLLGINCPATQSLHWWLRRQVFDCIFPTCPVYTLCCTAGNVPVQSSHLLQSFSLHLVSPYIVICLFSCVINSYNAIHFEVNNLPIYVGLFSLKPFYSFSTLWSDFRETRNIILLSF